MLTPGHTPPGCRRMLARLAMFLKPWCRPGTGAGFGFAKLAVLAALAPAACANSPDLTTRQGRFVNLVRILAESRQLDDPEEVGRILGTRFALEPTWPRVFKSRFMASCPREDLQTLTKYVYQAIEPFWYAFEGPPVRRLIYTVTRTTDCGGDPIAEVELHMFDLDKLFCVREADVNNGLPGVKAHPMPIHPVGPWTSGRLGGRGKAVGVQVTFGWPLLFDPPRRGECLQSVSISLFER